jgi:hypothetical protein
MNPQRTPPWPNGCRGAVSLTFDDGRASQLAIAIPLLNEMGLHSTFYLNPRGDQWLDNLAPWRSVVAAGHEVGNHTVNHPFGKALQDNPDIMCLERMTLADIEAEIVEASRRLREGIPEQAEFTYCYPCYLDHVGEGPTRQSYTPVVARHFVAGRGRGEFGRNHPATCDLAYLYSWNAEFLTGATLVGMAEQAAAMGCWVIFAMHGINEGALPISDVALRDLCVFLTRHRDTIWTAPVVTVAKCVSEWRKEQRNSP